MKVLMVEPSRLYQQILGILFQNFALETVCMSSGATALQQLGREAFDLVCVARHLEDMSGMQFCKALRQAVQARMPVILVTSEDDPAAFAESLKVGITEVFSKVNLDSLSEYLEGFVGQQQGYTGHGGRVLLVEDNPAWAHMVQRELTQIGVEVSHYSSGEAAYEAFLQGEYDLVLMDIVLEGHMTGMTLARMIRRTEGKKQRLPILAMSALDDEARKIELLRSGVNDYVSKPVIKEELIARVRNLLTNKLLLDKVEIQLKHLEQLAMTDPLTALYNRHCLVEFAAKHISEAHRHQYPLSLIVIDLDHFKSINDIYGHAMGDIVLVETARLIQASCRKEDFVARFGGEEFVLILPHCTGQDAVLKAEALRKNLMAMCPRQIPITASFGVAELPNAPGYDFDALFTMADKAVYRAKDQGRNRVVLWERDSSRMAIPA